MTEKLSTECNSEHLSKQPKMTETSGPGYTRDRTSDTPGELKTLV